MAENVDRLHARLARFDEADVAAVGPASVPPAAAPQRPRPSRHALEVTFDVLRHRRRPRRVPTVEQWLFLADFFGRHLKEGR